MDNVLCVGRRTLTTYSFIVPQPSFSGVVSKMFRPMDGTQPISLSCTRFTEGCELILGSWHGPCGALEINLLQNICIHLELLMLFTNHADFCSFGSPLARGKIWQPSTSWQGSTRNWHPNWLWSLTLLETLCYFAGMLSYCPQHAPCLLFSFQTLDVLCEPLFSVWQYRGYGFIYKAGNEAFFSITC